MFKVVLLLKKKRGLSRQDFIDYYNTKHIHLVAKLLGGGAAIHRRNFVVPQLQAGFAVGENIENTADTEYDVITEALYEDVAAAQAVMKKFEDPEIIRLIEEDETHFLEPGTQKRYIVETYETVFRPLEERYRQV